MQIVIDIPKEQYETLNAKSQSEVKVIINTPQLIRAIKNGTPLPEHHGDLIDRNKLIKQYGLENATKYGNKDAEQQKHSYSTMMMYEIADMIEDADTIIPATKKDCRDCNNWKTCECGEKGHKNGTSMGFSIGECKDYIPATEEGDAE